MRVSAGLLLSIDAHRAVDLAPAGHDREMLNEDRATHENLIIDVCVIDQGYVTAQLGRSANGRLVPQTHVTSQDRVSCDSSLVIQANAVKHDRVIIDQCTGANIRSRCNIGVRSDETTAVWMNTEAAVAAPNGPFNRKVAPRCRGALNTPFHHLSSLWLIPCKCRGETLEGCRPYTAV